MLKKSRHLKNFSAELPLYLDGTAERPKEGLLLKVVQR